MPDVFDERIKKAIPAMIYMFSGADDAQQACDVSNVKGFNLPDPAGKSGGACTSALLQTLWRDDDDDDVRYSWAETLELMREKIEEIGLTQVPQLSTSRPIDVNEEIVISNPTSGEGDDESEIGEGGVGVKRAMLVGVNYTGEPNALTSCHNDVRNMKDFLMQVHGFQRENMLVLMVSSPAAWSLAVGRRQRLIVLLENVLPTNLRWVHLLRSNEALTIFLSLIATLRLQLFDWSGYPFLLSSISICFRMMENITNLRSNSSWMDSKSYVKSADPVTPSFFNSQVRSSTL